MNSSQISENLSGVQITKLVFIEKFQIHLQTKIPVANFLISFFDVVNAGVFSWVGWAERLSRIRFL